MHKGGAAPLVGGAAARDVTAVFAGAACVAAWGEPARPGLPPEGETGKGAFDFLAAAGRFRACFVNQLPLLYRPPHAHRLKAARIRSPHNISK